MAQTNIIQNLKGYFDVREFNAKLTRDQWKLKGNDSTITFTVKYKSIPEQFAQYAKPHATRDGSTAYFVRFKIGANCKWFDKTQAPTPRPDNTYLDGKQFELTIAYATLNGNPEMKEASGYWCNAIMFREVENNPFEGIAAFEAPAQAQAADAPVATHVAQQYAHQFPQPVADTQTTIDTQADQFEDEEQLPF